MKAYPVPNEHLRPLANHHIYALRNIFLFPIQFQIPTTRYMVPISNLTQTILQLQYP